MRKLPDIHKLKESEYTYGQKFKQLFQNKKFLAPIFKNVVAEYKDLPLEEIENLILSVIRKAFKRRRMRLWQLLVCLRRGLKNVEKNAVKNEEKKGRRPFEKIVPVFKTGRARGRNWSDYYIWQYAVVGKAVWGILFVKRMDATKMGCGFIP